MGCMGEDAGRVVNVMTMQSQRSPRDDASEQYWPNSDDRRCSRLDGRERRRHWRDLRCLIARQIVGCFLPIRSKAGRIGNTRCRRGA